MRIGKGRLHLKPLFSVLFAFASALAFGQSPSPQSASPSATPPTTTSQAVRTSGRLDFNHDKTGFHLEGAHAAAKCESCHVEGILKGTPKDCAHCHTPGFKTSSVIIQNTSAHINVIPGVACDTCHTSSTDFRTWRMQHAATTAACSTCHSGQSFEGVVPTTKSPTHIQTTADCSTCHGSQTSFTAAVTGFDHSGVTGGCANCHNGAQAQGKPIGHLSTSLPCEQCHQPVPASTTSFKIWAMDHTGITSGCATCHNGQSFLGVAPMYKPVGHIPTTLACEVCHTSTQVPGGFAFAKAGFDHVANSVQPGTCTSCHNGTAAMGQIAGHITINAATQCDACHSMTAASFATWTMDHNKVSKTCSTCHAAGKSFVGATMVTMPKGAAHIPTTGECITCHSSTVVPGGFATWTMSHIGITTGCANCHNTGAPYPAVVTKPQPPGHIPTSAACEACHSASKTSVGNFTTGWAMNHTGIATGCATCHDTNVTSFGSLSVPQLVTKPVVGIGGHIPTPGVTACESCHSPSSTNVGGFVMAITGMKHTGIVSGCAQCHGTVNSGLAFKGMTPVFQPSSHVVTAQDCSACHTSTLIPGGFAVAASSFDHVKAGVQPGTCTSCHNGTTATGQIGGHIAVNPGTQCDACHNYALGSFAKWTMDHSKVSATCTTCHASGNTFPGATIVTSGTVNHFPIGAAQCSSCHTSQVVPGGFKTWTMDHTQVTSTSCATCHDTGKSFSGSVPVVTKPASGHLPTNAACDQCHTSTVMPGGFKTWTMNHTAVNATPCSTCHNTGVTLMASTPPLVTKPTGTSHIPTSATCNSCHTSTTVTGGFAIWTMNHTGIVSGCNTCHGSTTTLYSGVVSQPVGHPNTGTQDCSVCHTNTSIGGFAIAPANGKNPHTITAPSATCTTCHGNAAATFAAPGQPVGHIPTTGQCGSCHSWSLPSFAGSTMDHSAVNTATCAICHGAGKSFTGAMTTPLVTITSVTHIPVTADCVTCHSSKTVPGGFKTWTMNHTGVSTATCANCHGAVAGSFTNTSGTPIKTNLSVTHIPIKGDCAVCHSNTTVTGGFASWTMNHTGVTTTPCASCHGAGTAGSFTNTSGTPIKSNISVTHIAITGDCSVCHTSTTVPGGFTLWTMNHSGVTTSPCSSCHATGSSYTNTSGKTLVTKPANHFPIVGDCSVCHGTSYVSFAIPAPYSSMVHVGGVNTASCLTCHGDTPVSSYYGVTPVAKSSFPTHIATNGADCFNCHKSFTVPGGFVNASGSHVHSAADANQCYGCHSSAGPGKAQIAGHIATGSTSCDACHAYSTLSFAAPVAMNHTVVSGKACSSCHLQGGNQTIGASSLATLLGKPPGHIVTAAECNTCHTSQVVPGGFKVWTMNHTGVNTATCQNCHGNNTFATAIVPVFKPVNHVTTSSDCYVCHTSTTSFVLGSMSHAGISTGCQNCHGGQTYANVTPVTQPVNHIATTGGKAIDCAVCHSNTATFTAWVMNHSGVSIATCTNCHGGQTFATGRIPVAKAGNHITTTKDCLTCHSGTTLFAGGRMGTAEHVANGNNLVGTCTACHGGQAFQGVTPVTKPGNHITTTQDCSTCHSLTTFTTFAGTWNMSHTGITANCMSCHNGQTFATGVVPVSKTNTPSPGHVPTSADCSNCHTTTTPGGFAVHSNLSSKHTTVYMTSYSSTCYPTCHGTTSAIWYGVDYQALKSVSDHNPLGSKTNCKSCHSASDSKW